MTGFSVGKSPLRQSIEYCGRCKGARVYVQDESKNPFGTFKDRRNAAILSLESGESGLLFVQVTSGNSGYSLGMLSKMWAENGVAAPAREKAVKDDKDDDRQVRIVRSGGISPVGALTLPERSMGSVQVVNIVSKKTDPKIKAMLRTCSIVHEADLGNGIIPQSVQRDIARKAARFDGPDDRIRNVETYDLDNGYRVMVHEISERGITPTYIFCPVGEGELASELASEAGKVWGDKAPKIVGVTIPGNAIAAQADFLKKVRPSIADKLENGYSKFKELVKNFIEKGRMELVTVKDNEIAREYRFLNSIGIASEPSAAAAFAGAVKYPLNPEDIVVIINTGKGIYDQKSVDRIWQRRLARAGKTLAVIAASFIAAIAIMVALHRYREGVEKENRFLRLQQRELSQQHERESLRLLLESTARAMDRDGDHEISEAEFSDIYHVVPGLSIPYGSAQKYHNYESFLGRFTERELRFYIRQKELDRYSGRVEMMIRHDLRVEREKWLASNPPKEISIDDRLLKIFLYRSVRRKMEGMGDNEKYCTFREFDANNPFDPSKEELCD